jgi:hypothetical protein
VTKVEQSENIDLLGVEPASGACLVVKPSSWPIQYFFGSRAGIWRLFGREDFELAYSILYMDFKLCFGSFRLCILFVSIQLLRKTHCPFNKFIAKMLIFGPCTVPGTTRQ